LNVVPALLVDRAVFVRAFVKKNFATRCDFQAQNTQKCVCGELGEITELLRPPSGSRFATREGKGEKEEKEEKGRGLLAFLHFFFYNLTTAQQCIVAATYTRSLDLALQLAFSSVCRHNAD